MGKYTCTPGREKVGKLTSALITAADIARIHKVHAVERWSLDILKYVLNEINS
jgi:histone H3/H4